jgi:hypothetical protein
MYYQKCNRVNLFRRNINFIEFEITKNLAENQNDINREEETCLNSWQFYSVMSLYSPNILLLHKVKLLSWFKNIALLVFSTKRHRFVAWSFLFYRSSSFGTSKLMLFVYFSPRKHEDMSGLVMHILLHII